MKFEESTKNNFKKEEICGSMIYFLTKNEEVVYVGQSKEGLNRISFHSYTEKDFDNFYFINCPVEKLNDLENYYIMKYFPKYNKMINRNGSSLISYTNFYCLEYKYDKAPRLSFAEAKKEIIRNSLYEVKFKSSLYINKKDIDKINKLLTNISLIKRGGK